MNKKNSSQSVQYAYEMMKEWILSGVFAPGEKINQDSIASKLGTSRMPIRHSLERLHSEGLVIVTPHRGAIVTPMSSENLNALYALCSQFEAMALIEAMDKITDEDIANLYSLLDLQKNHSNLSTATILEQNRTFHRTLVELCGNEPLLRILNNVWEQIERYRIFYFKHPGSIEHNISDHYHLLDLIVQHKTQEAADFLVEHARYSQKILLAAFEQELPPLRYKTVALL